MQKRMMIPLAIALAFLFLTFTGCGTSTPAKFYMLNSISGQAKANSAEKVNKPVSVGIGPVEMPAYLDRQQIVTRVNKNQVDLAMFHEWAEPLKDNFVRVLAENLSALDTQGMFAVYPMRGPSPVDYQLEMEVVRLDGGLGGEVLLVARWTVFEGTSKRVLLSRKSTIREETGSEDYGSLVAAQSRAVEALSREIAAVMKDLSK